ncbi:hypothetical protein BU26DRAFT_508118 [Trematosphaeria pertusa]|uniref:Uncharacterized protein n=1 Tax=Trematosphaeria pertusa TaxID=390896 RepID=A0A6A6I566_9PLEO|nr:uncharacterized protein BU26DRAFT_508118 [Trematosphaeria pertusa]KAF2245467.1 hypothetical protein BU26DRAFT_508118 [Trematosphaeria pertusa]
MAHLPPNSPYGLPSSPRAIRQTLAPLDTSLRPMTSPGPSPYLASEKRSPQPSPQPFVDTRQRNRDSLIFINATIPLSPASSSENSFKEEPFDGLAPRKRTGLARLFCCFGRQERARRRATRFTEYEKVGEKCHWSEL